MRLSVYHTKRTACFLCENEPRVRSVVLDLERVLPLDPFYMEYPRVDFV